VVVGLLSDLVFSIGAVSHLRDLVGAGLWEGGCEH
jgi:hypothetical protein